MTTLVLISNRPTICQNCFPKNKLLSYRQYMYIHFTSIVSLIYIIQVILVELYKCNFCSTVMQSIFFFFAFLLAYLLYTAMSVCALQQSDPARCTHTSLLFGISFPVWSLQSIEWGSLCCRVGSSLVMHLILSSVFTSTPLS